jgi:hypothetical protein
MWLKSLTVLSTKKGVEISTETGSSAQTTLLDCPFCDTTLRIRVVDSIRDVLIMARRVLVRHGMAHYKVQLSAFQFKAH